MALIKCIECGEKVSGTVEICPKCNKYSSYSKNSCIICGIKFKKDEQRKTIGSLCVSYHYDCYDKHLENLSVNFKCYDCKNIIEISKESIDSGSLVSCTNCGRNYKSCSCFICGTYFYNIKKAVKSTLHILGDKDLCHAYCAHKRGKFLSNLGDRTSRIGLFILLLIKIAIPLFIIYIIIKLNYATINSLLNNYFK